ncbi:hypothetical protein AMELA_G00024890 [Ameiurus melas]|uniref:Uncharacterized protein n=1 Tax=Ameiurus melas TaxID=219545 RepID=A0A7J6BCP1_AMEME|nr:hypothetical protein AMELA_G00024890 [Ameiurus melas]
MSNILRCLLLPNILRLEIVALHSFICNKRFFLVRIGVDHGNTGNKVSGNSIPTID